MNADVTRPGVTAAQPATLPPGGTSRRGALLLALSLVLGPCVLFFGALVFVSLLHRVASPIGYSTLADLVLVVLGLLIPAGIVAAVVVLVRGSGPPRAIAPIGARPALPTVPVVGWGSSLRRRSRPRRRCCSSSPSRGWA